MEKSLRFKAFQDIEKRADDAATYIKKKIDKTPDVAIILGSGLSGFENMLETFSEIPYSEIPGFLKSTAPGHTGKLIFAEHAGKSLLIMSGRFHYYEGYSMQEITIPVRMMAILGIKRLIITNAAGAVNTAFCPGDLMLIEDHINLSGDNPLIGPNIDSLGERFPDMTNTYTPDLVNTIMKKSEEIGIMLRKGVYTYMTGPSYESPAEVRMIRNLGGDAVGMSSVPEAIVARHAGMEVIGISCLTNMAAGIINRALDGDEVISAGKKAMANFSKVILIAIEC